MTNDRVRLPEEKQKEFLNNAIQREGGVNGLAKFLHVSERTIRDWRREKFLMPYRSLMQISHAYNVPLPKDMQREKRFWYVTKGAQRGGLASYEKQGGVIGDPVVRKQKWREWWEEEGKIKMPATFYPLPFTPAEKSVELAEFIGIMMGDGGMTHRQLSITLHHIDDLAYSHFVVALIKKLFVVTPTVRHVVASSVNIILVSRSGLIKYLHELGLPIGNKLKQHFDIPPWIKENRDYMLACVRGLVDTDGCMFTHRYRVNGKLYSYKKMDFCSYSPPLINSVKDFLETLDLRTRISGGVDIRIENKASVKRYMQLIGSHNEKHLKRWKNEI